MDRVEIAVQLKGPARTETFLGREHLVVPATLVQSQVLNNNLGKTFLPPEEINDAWAETANGSPVVIDHPTRQGHAVTAKSPDVLNARGIGFLFARAENQVLKGDVYLDPARADQVDGLPAVLERVRKGEPVELSTGFPVLLEATPGVHNGQSYDKVLRPRGFDHLAVFADKIGACSIKDGCGLGVNHAGECDVTPELPIDLSRFPKAEDPMAAARDSVWKRFLNNALRALGIRRAGNESDDDRRSLLNSLLREKFGAEDRFVWVESMDSTTNTVVWSVEVQGEGDGAGLFQAEFQIDEDGTVSIGEPSKVRRVTTFEPAANAPGDLPTEEAMNREQMIAQLAANGRDKETLAKLSDCDLKALHATLGAPPAPKDDPDTIAHLQEQLIAERKKNETLQAESATALQAEKKELADKQVDLIHNGETAYSPAEIRAMNIVQVRKLWDTVFPRRADFSGGRPVPRGAAVNSASDFSFARRSTMGAPAQKEN